MRLHKINTKTYNLLKLVRYNRFVIVDNNGLLIGSYIKLLKNPDWSMPDNTNGKGCVYVDLGNECKGLDKLDKAWLVLK